MEKLKLHKNDFKMIAGLIIGTIIYCFGIVFVADLGNFYSGGITGIAQLIASVVHWIFPDSQQIGLKSTIIVLFNAPLFIIAWKGVSRKFAVASLASVLMQTVIIALFEYFQSKGFNPFLSLSERKEFLTLSIFGGLLLGLGNSLPLKYGASTGGIDVVSQYVSLKYNMSFSKVTFGIDMFIILSAALIGYFKDNTLDPAVYTIIRMIISVLVIDKIYTIYKYAEVTIVTELKDEMRDKIMANSNHGLSIYEIEGGYSHAKKYVMKSVVWSFETRKYRDLAVSVDPHAFISVTKIKHVDGRFRKNVIV